MTIQEILAFNFLKIGDFQLSLSHVILAMVIMVIARITIWVIRRILERYFRKKKIDTGRRFAIVQFIKYIVYTGALLMAVEAMGISLSLLWGGAAALMVGIGLGLQQTFNDLISGVILLIEGSVAIDDVVEVDGVVGHVTDIGIRTSQVETRDRITLLIPNSKLVGDKAVNWSHNEETSRFAVNVGVSYSSDIVQVTRLLLQAANEHDSVLKKPSPQVQFKDFGNSSLDFVLYFFSTEYLQVELIKSDIRYKIMQLFRQNKVEIPFPQRDLWLRNAADLVPLRED